GDAALEAARECLVHGGVVVARRDAGDVEAPVLRTHRTLAIKYDTGGHRGLAHRVADVEAFDALRGPGQSEQFLQRSQPSRLRRGAAGLRVERVLGIALRQLQETRALAAHLRLHLDLAAGVL